MVEDKKGHATLSRGDEDVRSARVLPMKTLKLLRKTPRVPMYVREFARLTRQMASAGVAITVLGIEELKMWKVFLHCDERGKKYFTAATVTKGKGKIPIEKKRNKKGARLMKRKS